jgi:Domain of unknown function (DUF4845)
MRRRQTGVSLMALIFGFAILVIVAIFAMKVVPSYMEYRSAKAAVEILGRTGGSPADIRRGWESRSAIDNITTVSAKDLEITREGNQTVVGFAYRKEVPLFSNLGVYIDFAANSGEQ